MPTIDEIVQRVLSDNFNDLIDIADVDIDSLVTDIVTEETIKLVKEHLKDNVTDIMSDYIYDNVEMDEETIKEAIDKAVQKSVKSIINTINGQVAQLQNSINSLLVDMTNVKSSVRGLKKRTRTWFEWLSGE